MKVIQEQLDRALRAKPAIAGMTDAGRQAIIRQLAQMLSANSGEIISENLKDLARMSGADPKFDRLKLNESRIAALHDSLLKIAALPDPTGCLISEQTLDNGLLVQKKTVALGVVGVIYESRPNVTVDVAALCLRSGNACLLRGGQDAQFTNAFIIRLIQDVLSKAGVNRDVVQQLPADRKYILDILKAKHYIDVIIPRGSAQLINYVRENSLVPVIETGAGVCHTYIERTADMHKAVNIVVNAKSSRPSVCNALDTILVDEFVAAEFIKALALAFLPYKIEVFADPLGYELLHEAGYPYRKRAGAEDYGREFLDFKCSLKVVSGLIEALAHIAMHSSKHSEAIVTEDNEAADRFLNEVDAAAVYLNASTRFTDGEVFGLGAEIGISTQKLHARGPFALEKLVTEKWIIKGEGQIR
ncbi:glutamate-5-semialdehyde dehydrogenase [Pedobacter faecalis]|uniref:glutamate-5-semialdehyde dehydrogenase n=1 Tax=Pedobacter faecalis TaxID=3041495 RepID=UPI00254B3001|nr:glutamate-5-semialdehyde dehydrogenase [Pedobacter sp. ELA7]